MKAAKKVLMGYVPRKGHGWPMLIMAAALSLCVASGAPAAEVSLFPKETVLAEASVPRAGPGLSMAANSPVFIKASREDAASTPAQAPVSGAVTPGVTEFKNYLRVLLERHPELKMLRAEADAKGEAPSQAGALPNPQLSVGFMDLPVDSLSFSEEDMTRKSVGLKQSFYAPGKLELMRKVAEGDKTIAEGDLGEKRLELVERARIAFYQLRYLLRIRGYAVKNKETLRGFIDVALAKYAVGQGIQQDALAAQLEYSKTSEYLIRIEQQLATIRKSLNVSAGLPSDTDWSGPAIDPPGAIEGGEDDLLEKAVARRPVFRRLETSIRKAEDEAELARKSLSPDYSLSVSYSQRDNGEMRRSDMVSMEVMFDLPWYRSSKEERKIAESVLMADRAREEYQAEKLRVRQEIIELTDMQERDGKLAVLFDTGLLPQAEQAVEASVSAYRVNKVDFRWLVMNQVAYFDYEVQRAQVEFELFSARAKLLRVLGDDGLEAGYEN